MMMLCEIVDHKPGNSNRCISCSNGQKKYYQQEEKPEKERKE
jgi:hypothetical protein